MGPLKKDLTRAGGRVWEALGGSSYRVLRVWEALGGSIYNILRVWMGVWGVQILTGLTYRVGPLEKDLTRAGGRVWGGSGRLNLSW